MSNLALIKRHMSDLEKLAPIYLVRIREKCMKAAARTKSEKSREIWNQAIAKCDLGISGGAA